MAIAPRNYDLDELRAASGSEGAGTGGTEPSKRSGERSEAGGDAAAWPGAWHDGVSGEAADADPDRPAADALDAYRSGLDDPRANAENDLDADDHRVSLHYVARLAALARG